MRAYPPNLKKSRLDVSNSMLHNDWLDIPCICHSFILIALKLEGLVTRIPKGIFCIDNSMLN